MSIVVDRITKTYRLRGKPRAVLRDFSLTIPPDAKIGLLGQNGAGKSTLLRLLGGVERPDKGRITRNMRVSWPIGFAGFFQGNMSGAANVRFCARIYRRDPSEIIEKVAEFAEIGPYLHETVRTYSTGMRARLAFGLSMAIDFDCLLIDEVTAVGDARFRDRSERALAERRESAGMVLVSHNLGQIKRLCDTVITLKPGAEPEFSNDVETAVEEHRSYLKAHRRK